MDVYLTRDPKFRPEVVRKWRALENGPACEVLFELEKLADSGALDKERVAVLNDRYDVYVLEPPPPAPKVIAVADPREAIAVIVDLVDGMPDPHMAASWSADALGEPVGSIHVFERR